MSIEKKQQVRKDITPRRWIIVDFGFWHHRGNRRPHFAIIGTVYDKDTGARCDGYAAEFGCIHEQIAEHFPELANLIRWHLVDDDASPMHYTANAAYWLEFHHSISEWTFDVRDGRTPLDVFKSTVVWREGVDSIADLLDPIHVQNPPGVIFENYATSKAGKADARRLLAARVIAWRDARTPPLIDDMKHDLEAAGVEYMSEREIAAA